MSHKLSISLLLISLLMLSGCPGSGGSSGSNSTNEITDNSPGEPPGEEPPIEEPFEVGLFTLEETTMDQVHEALAGWATRPVLTLTQGLSCVRPVH